MFVYVSTLLVVPGSSPFSLLESFCISRHFLRVSSDSRPTSEYVQSVNPGCAVALSPPWPCAPFHSGELFIVLFHVTAHSKHLFAYITLIHHFEAGLGITAGFKRLPGQALARIHPSVLKILLQASFNQICHCCQCSSIKKNAAPPSVSREVKPLEEVHFDIFTFNGQYTVYLIDRGSRAEFIYSVDKKSDISKALQQFLIDCKTASFPVWSFVH